VVANRLTGEECVPNFGQYWIAVTIATLASVGAHADTLTVAVASNFAEPLRDIASKFEAKSGHEVLISPGSTGKLYAQIIHGAPYDIFLSADAHRPELLEQKSMIVAGSRFTYSVGQLVAWSRDSEFANSACVDGLQQLGEKKLAIANPALAPYGLAAKQYLVGRGLWGELQKNLVFGENIAQTLQFAASGGASIALIAESQLRRAKDFAATCAVPIAGDTHDPILQQAVQMARESAAPAVGQFLEFLRGPKSRAIIRHYGYLLPEPQ